MPSGTDAMRPGDHLGLLYLCARKLSASTEMPVDELVGPMYIALERACRGFDPARGCRFSTYAHSAMIREGLKFVRAQWGHPPNGRDQERHRRERSAFHRHRFGQLLRGDAEEPSDPWARERLRAAIADLPEREQDVLRMRLSGYTLQDVGAAMGHTRESIRLIERRALASLAESLGVEIPTTGLDRLIGRVSRIAPNGRPPIARA